MVISGMLCPSNACAVSYFEKVKRVKLGAGHLSSFRVFKLWVCNTYPALLCFLELLLLFSPISGLEYDVITMPANFLIGTFIY